MELGAVATSWMCQAVEAIQRGPDLDGWIAEKGEGRCS
jgi:hypothetical protein